MEQGVELRDKARGICELVTEPGKLQYEREFAKQTREKFSGISSAGNTAQPTTGNTFFNKGTLSAGPASGSEKYGGFGSEDIARFGYNND